MSRLGAANTRGGLREGRNEEERREVSAHILSERSHDPSAPAGCRERWGRYSAARQSPLSNKARNPDISVKTFLIFKCWQQIPNIFKYSAPWAKHFF